jgi:hypothetical protein
MAMEEYEDTFLVLLNRFLDMLWPFATLFILLITYPPLAVWRVLKWLFTFPLAMQDRVVVVTGASSGIGQVRLKLRFSNQQSFLRMDPVDF